MYCIDFYVDMFPSCFFFFHYFFRSFYEGIVLVRSVVVQGQDTTTKDP